MRSVDILVVKDAMAAIISIVKCKYFGRLNYNNVTYVIFMLI